MQCLIRVCTTCMRRGRGGLVVNTSDSGSRGRGLEPHSGRRVVTLSKTYLPPKVLVIPWKRWLRPNMTEKLFTGTLSFKQTKTACMHMIPNATLCLFIKVKSMQRPGTEAIRTQIKPSKPQREIKLQIVILQGEHIVKGSRVSSSFPKQPKPN